MCVSACNFYPQTGVCVMIRQERAPSFLERSDLWFLEILNLRSTTRRRENRPSARRSCDLPAPHHSLALIDRVHHKALATHIHSEVHDALPLSVVVHRARIDAWAFGSTLPARRGPLRGISLVPNQAILITLIEQIN
jgi:hypothetical protein